jgi:hypothetical protein
MVKLGWTPCRSPQSLMPSPRRRAFGELRGRCPWHRVLDAILMSRFSMMSHLGNLTCVGSTGQPVGSIWGEFPTAMSIPLLPYLIRGFTGR